LKTHFIISLFARDMSYAVRSHLDAISLRFDTCLALCL